MKTLIIAFQLLWCCLYVAAQVNPNYHYVEGYYRSNGTYVEGYYRTNPNSTINDNYSTYPNINPWSGKVGTVQPENYSSNVSFSIFNKPNYSTEKLDYELKNYQAPSGGTYYAVIPFLEIKSGPSDEYRTEHTVDMGTKMEVISSTDFWHKVKYFKDGNSYTGYVSTAYLSKTNPIKSQIVTPQRYSKIPAIPESPYGKGKGRLTVYTSCSTEGNIKVYLDGSYIGTLSNFFTGAIPSCGEEGTIHIDKPAGTYKVTATGHKLRWEFSITITADKCLVKGLKSN